MKPDWETSHAGCLASFLSAPMSPLDTDGINKVTLLFPAVWWSDVLLTVTPVGRPKKQGNKNVINVVFLHKEWLVWMMQHKGHVSKLWANESGSFTDVVTSSCRRKNIPTEIVFPAFQFHRHLLNPQRDFCLETLFISVPDPVHASVQSTAWDISAHLQRAIVLNYKCGYLPVLPFIITSSSAWCGGCRSLSVQLRSAEDAEKTPVNTPADCLVAGKPQVANKMLANRCVPAVMCANSTERILFRQADVRSECWLKKQGPGDVCEATFIEM